MSTSTETAMPADYASRDDRATRVLAIFGGAPAFLYLLQRYF